MINNPKILFINTVYGVGSTGKIVANLFQMAESKGMKRMLHTDEVWSHPKTVQ